MENFEAWVSRESEKLGINFASLDLESRNRLLEELMSGLENGFRSRMDSPDLRFGKRRNIYKNVGDATDLSQQEEDGYYSPTYSAECFHVDDDPQTCNVTYSGGCTDQSTQGCTNMGCSNSSGSCTNDGNACLDLQCNNTVCTNFDGNMCNDQLCQNSTMCSNQITGECQDNSCNNSMCQDNQRCFDSNCNNNPGKIAASFCSDFAQCLDAPSCSNNTKCNDNNPALGQNVCMDNTCKNDPNCFDDVGCFDLKCENKNSSCTDTSNANYKCTDNNCFNYHSECRDGSSEGECLDYACLNEATSDRKCVDYFCSDRPCANKLGENNCQDEYNCTDYSCYNQTSTRCIDSLTCIDTHCGNMPPLEDCPNDNDTQSTGCQDVGVNCNSTDRQPDCFVDHEPSSGCPTDGISCIMDQRAFCIDEAVCIDGEDCVNSTNCIDNGQSGACLDTNCENTGGEYAATCTDQQSCSDQSCTNNTMCMDESSCNNDECNNSNCFDFDSACTNNNCTNEPNCTTVPGQ